MNTSTPAAVASRRRRFAPIVPLRALALVLTLAALACSLGACASGGSPAAQTLLSETFESHKPVESGRIALALALTPDRRPGGAAAPKLLAVALSGPFQGLGAGRLPHFALKLRLTASGHTLQAGATSTANQIYIEIAGTPFVAPPGTAEALQKSYAQTTRAASSAQSRATFAGLGIDPGEWLVDPQIVGVSADGETTHISGRLDATRFLADAQKVSGAGGALGLGGLGSALPSAGGIGALAGSVRSARVDVYTGTHDHELQRVLLSANLAATPQTRAALGVSSGATLTFDLRFAELNQPQTISPPANAKPISDLVPALEQLGLSLGSSSAAAG
jgi:hypothetical protein